MIYNIYIDKENLVESYIMYYDSIKCKFQKIEREESKEFKFLVCSVVSDYLNSKEIFDTEYVICPVINKIKTFNNFFEFLYNSSFFETQKCKFEIINNYVKYIYTINLI